MSKSDEAPAPAGGAGRPPVPARRLDPAALERVLARAAELQSSSGEPTEDLTEDQLLEMAKEVGLSTSHLRQALAEERTRSVVVVPTAGGPLARTLGDGVVSAARTVRERPDAVLRAVDAWMQREECLQVKRHFPERIVWETRRDLFGSLRRGLDIGGRGYALARAHDVSGTVVAVDTERTLVRLDADLGEMRGRFTRNTIIVSGFGGAASVSAVMLGFMLPVAVVPAVALIGGSYLAARRQYTRALARTQLALEQVLDRLERGDLTRPPSLIEAIASAAARPRR